MIEYQFRLILTMRHKFYAMYSNLRTLFQFRLILTMRHKFYAMYSNLRTLFSSFRNAFE